MEPRKDYNMKRTAKKLISLILVVSMIFTTTITAFAQRYDSGEQILVEVQDELGELKITYQVTNSGDKIFSQYLNEELIIRNIVLRNEPNLVNQTSYINTSINDASKFTIMHEPVQTTYLINDYIIETPLNQNQRNSTSAHSSKLGRINYHSYNSYEGIIYYGLDVSYTYDQSLSSYTVRSFVGNLVDLVTIVCSAIAFPKAMVATFIKRLLLSAGITLSGGVLSDALSTTMSSIKTTYDMELVNISDTNHTKMVYGYKYYISDDNYPDAKGEVYYEGYVPQDWKKQHLAVWLHDEMFGYSSFDVVSWT